MPREFVAMLFLTVEAAGHILQMPACRASGWVEGLAGNCSQDSVKFLIAGAEITSPVCHTV